MIRNIEELKEIVSDYLEKLLRERNDHTVTSQEMKIINNFISFLEEEVFKGGHK